jgi:hypothetical protein
MVEKRYKEDKERFYYNNHNPIKNRMEYAALPFVLVWEILKLIYRGLKFIFNLFKKTY